MRLFEHRETETKLDRLPELPPDVEVPDDISGLKHPARKSSTGGFRWMRWVAAILVVGAVGGLAAMLSSSSDPADVPATDNLATYGTDNPVILQEGALPGTIEIVGTVNLMDRYGTDNPVFVEEPSLMELYGTDNPVFVPATPFMELYGTDNPVFVPEVADAVDTGQYFELYGTDNPVFEEQ